MIKIELDLGQEQKYEAWKQGIIEKHKGKLPNIGAIGGHFGITVIFTSIGQIIKGISWDNQEIDLTDYSNF